MSGKFKFDVSFIGLKKAAAFFGVGLSLAFVAIPANAATIDSSLDVSTESSQTNNQWCQSLGTGLSGMLDSVEVYMGDIGQVATTTIQIKVASSSPLDAGDCSTATVVASGSFRNDNLGDVYIDIPLDSPIELNSNNYYIFENSYPTGDARSVFGSSFPAIDSDKQAYFYTGAVNGTLGTAYYVLKSSFNLDFDQDLSFSSGAYQTKFLSLNATATPNPPQNTDVEFTVDYFLDQNELDSTKADRNVTLVNFNLSGSGAFGVYINNTVSTSSATYTFEDLSDGQYDLLIRFANTGSAISGLYPFEDSYVYYTFSVNDGVLTAVSGVELYDGTVVDEARYQECSLSNFSGCIINSFTYLFVPTDAQISTITESTTIMKETFPISWFFELSDSIDGVVVSNDSFPTYTMDLPFLGSNFEILSQSTIDKFVDNNARLTFRNLFEYTLYLSFIAMAFFMIMSALNRAGNKIVS